MTSRLLVLGSALLLLAACGGPSPEERLQRAAEYEASGRYQAAIIELRNALQEQPGLAEARLTLGLVFLQLGDYLSAVAELERAADLGLESMELREGLALARVASGEERYAREVVAELGDQPAQSLSVSLAASLGRALQRLGREEAAREVLAALVDRAPDSPQARLAMARLDWSQGQVDAARAQARAAVAVAPEDQEALMLYGELLLAGGEFAEAQEVFRDMVNLATSRGASAAFARLGLARALIATGEFGEVANIVEQILRELPELPAAHYLEALVHLENAELTDANQSLERVLTAVPDHSPSRYLRAAVAFREDRFERARDDLDRVIARDPANLRARMLLAAVHAERDRHDRAVSVLRAGLREPGLEPGAGYYAALGQSLLRAGQSQEEGLEMLGRAVAAAPDAAGIRARLALAHLATGATGMAEAELQQAVDLTESFPLSDTLLVLIQLEQQRFDEALASARRFVDRNPDAPMALNMLGAAHLGRGETDAAREAFERAVDLAPGFAPAALNLAAMNRSAGELDAAGTRLEAVLDSDPDNRTARLRLAALAQEQGRLDDAIGLLRAPWEQDRTDQQLSLALADLYSAAGDAANVFESVSGLGADADVSDRVLAVRARSGLQAGRIEAALGALEELASRRPDDDRIGLGLAPALAGVDETRRAMEVLAQQIGNAERAATSMLRLYADLLIRSEQLDGAESVIEELEGRSDAAFATALLQGDLARARNRPEAAIEPYARAHRLQPSSELLRRLHVARSSAGVAEEGRAELEAWLADNPDDAAVRGLLAEVLLASGDHEAAIDEYEQLLEQLPGSVAVLNNLAWLYGETGHPDAIATARRALELAPDLAPVQDTLGWVLIHHGDPAEGLDLLRQAAAASPDSAQTQYHLAVGLERSGATEEARAALRRALDAGGFDEVSEARALLERLEG